MHMHQCKSEVEEEEGVTLLFHILQNTQLVAHQPSQPLLCLCARDLYHTVWYTVVEVVNKNQPSTNTEERKWQLLLWHRVCLCVWIQCLRAQISLTKDLFHDFMTRKMFLCVCDVHTEWYHCFFVCFWDPPWILLWECVFLIIPDWVIWIKMFDLIGVNNTLGSIATKKDSCHCLGNDEGCMSYVLLS